MDANDRARKNSPKPAQNQRKTEAKPKQNQRKTSAQPALNGPKTGPEAWHATYDSHGLECCITQPMAKDGVAEGIEESRGE